jgi:hypothetical protein
MRRGPGQNERPDVPQVITSKEMAALLAQDLRRRPEFGFWKAVADTVLESRNPFEPKAARPPKRWFVLVSLLTLLGGGCFVYFDLLH